MTIHVTCARCHVPIESATHICADQPVELEQIVRGEIERWLHNDDFYPLLGEVPPLITKRILTAGYRKTT